MNENRRNREQEKGDLTTEWTREKGDLTGERNQENDSPGGG